MTGRRCAPGRGEQYPREIEFLDELPKTATGKVRRGELEARAEESADAERPGVDEVSENGRVEATP